MIVACDVEYNVGEIVDGNYFKTKSEDKFQYEPHPITLMILRKASCEEWRNYKEEQFGIRPTWEHRFYYLVSVD